MSTLSASDLESRRFQMVETQIIQRGICDQRLLKLLRELPREFFLPDKLKHRAYEDRALPVVLGQTISQPYIVAYMTEALNIEPHHRVLEIGTGTGYQTAILARLSSQVYSVERFEEMSHSAKQRLESLQLNNVFFQVGDGSLGWPEHAPYDRIMITAAAPRIIQNITDQLIEGGRMIMPVEASGSQRLTLIEKHDRKIIERPSMAVRFVRLVGECGFEN